MVRFMGWLLMGLIAGALLAAIGVPLTYFTSNAPRVIYLPIACVVAWIVYMMCFYFIIYRPLQTCVNVITQKRFSDRICALTREVEELYVAADKLCVENKSLTSETSKVLLLTKETSGTAFTPTSATRRTAPF